MDDIYFILFMNKKCIICGMEAQFLIKDTSDYYCEECALEQFSDVSLLVKVEEKTKKIKELVDNKDGNTGDGF